MNNGDRKQISLRPLHKRDAEACYVNLTQRIYHTTGGLPHPYTLTAAFSYIRKSQQARRKGTDEIFAIQNDTDGILVGMIGIHSLNSREGRAMLGYWIAKKEWGSGIATTAVGHALKFAFKEKRLQKVYAYVFVTNVASQRVLEKNGFVREGLLRRHFRVGRRYVDSYIFGLLREEWRKQTSSRLNKVGQGPIQ